MRESMPHPTKQMFVKTKRLLDDFFVVDEYKGSYEQYDNSMSPEQRLLVFERGDSVAALLFDPSHREVILVEQFRLPTVGRGQGSGWILELPAGILKASETPHECMVRELHEETGYQVSNLVPISTFFVSPGGTSERIFLFYAEVRRVQQKATGGGVRREGENIRIVRMPIAEFFAKLRNQEFEDAKLVIAAQWLKERRATMAADDAAPAPPVERKVKLPISRARLGLKPKPEKIVGYLRGNIEKVTGVDVWVNPLVSDMLLDRVTDRTISAVIRARGAEKYPDGKRIKQDTIGEELRHAMNGRNFVSPATVIDTSAGALSTTNGVKRVFHVATTHGEFGSRPRVQPETLDGCVDNVLAEIERKGSYRSVLFPMIGTGEGGLLVNEVASRLLQRAIFFFHEHPRARLQKIYFLAYSEIDADVVADAFHSIENNFEPLQDAQPAQAARACETQMLDKPRASSWVLLVDRFLTRVIGR